MLKHLLNNDTQLVAQLPLISETERQTLLYKYNATAASYPKQQRIHQLFEQQVERTPDAIALVYDDQNLSYIQLNHSANLLAQHLITLGIRPNDRVALCVERSMSLIVGLLGTLKAGGVYVPLDASYPQIRLEFMLQDSAPNILLCDSITLNRLSAVAEEIPRLNLSEASDPWLDECIPHSNPKAFAQNAELAYIIYTSGSRGTPKGVEMPHSNLINLLYWQNKASQLKNPTKTLQFSPISFDVSVQEIFSTLSTGGTLVLISQEISINPLLLLQFIKQQEINRLFLPFIMLEQLAYYSMQNNLYPATLTEVNVAGEQLRINANIINFFQVLSGCRLVNQYGPSETHVVTAYPLAQDSLHWNRLPPIGRPIANTQIYILDNQFQPVPIAVVGELYIGGAGVARGYLNRPELTAERFIADPFSGQPQARLYKTGDMARWLTNGEIEFIGRNDDQVKIRGFRIELGEIETVLLHYPGIREAVILTREEGADKSLVAYYTSNDIPSAEALRTHLCIHLPDYMLPVAYVHLDTFPLTPNGKLDTQALPVPGNEHYAVQSYVAPQDETESIVAAIWSELLNVSHVGRQDNFFKLGGHSLLAVQVISRLRSVCTIEVSLHQLFIHPVLSDFARSLKSATLSLLPPIEPVDRNQPLPLSFAQQRLWFLAQIENVSSAYHIPFGVRISGDLNIVALRQALNGMIARHEVLRTTFTAIDGIPEQRISPAETRFMLIEHDLSSQPNAETLLKEYISYELKDAFDLERDALIRGRLITLGEKRFVLLITQHHIISDGWSMGLIMHEISLLYAAILHQTADPLPPLTVQYADYAAWQRRWLTEERLQAQAAYWKSALAGVPVLLSLPTDHPRPTQQNHAGAWIEVVLDSGLSRSVKAFSLRHGVTTFMTLLASWAVVLARLSGQNSLVIGIPSANRGREEIENLIGFFVNTLALRIDMTADMTVADLVNHVKHQTITAQANQDIPFEQVVELIQVPRSLAHTPLFQVMFAWQNVPEQPLALPELNLTPLILTGQTSKFDLSLSLSEADDQILGSIEYATDLFDQTTIERWLGHFQAVLRSILIDDELKIAEICLLNAHERHQIVKDFNATDKAYPKDKLIHQLFEEQALCNPDAIAVIFEDQQMTYGELNSKSNQLAHFLRNNGVGPDVLVAIFVDRSLEMIIGIMGILKAGGAYVPLDPSYPAERIAYMLEDTDPKILLTQQRLIDSLPLIQALIVALDRDWSSLANLADTNIDPRSLGINSKHLAYVIYTSGSTGLPKGVSISHSSVNNLWHGLNQSIYPNYKLHQFVSLNAFIAFDASVKQIVQLLSGHTLIIIPDNIRLDGDLLANFLKNHPIDVFDCTPTQLRIMWVAGFFEKIDCLPSVILVGGEAIELTLWKTIQDLSNTTFFNVYGPTECTVDSVVCRITKQQKFPILGRPIANTQIYILDTQLQPVPIGVAGELFIGGDGLARGYLNQPELTDERFITSPFSTDPSLRLYKTGDLGRWCPDGNIEYLGRNDYQVKIRGFRIELAEIETQLVRIPMIQEASVLVREDVPGDKRLVAYLTLKQNDGETAHPLLDIDQVRKSLHASLPEYMLPSAFVTLAVFPITPNGKLDRNALPVPGGEHYAQQQYVAPQDEIEIKLASIWSELLNVQQIGRDDNFFELGGHSLLSVLLLTKINKIFQTKLSLVSIFNFPTLAQLAQLISENAQPIMWTSLFHNNPMGSRPPLFWIQGGSHANEVYQHIGADQPTYGLLYGIGLPPKSKIGLPPIQELAAHYIAEIRLVQPNGPYFLIGHSAGGLIALEMAQQLKQNHLKVGFIALGDTYLPGLHKQIPLSINTKLTRLMRTPLALLKFKMTQSMSAFKTRLRNRLGLTHYRPEKYDALFIERSIAGYQPKPYSGRVILFQATSEISLTTQIEPLKIGWQKLVGSGLSVHEIPGDHYDFLKGAGAKEIAKIIREAMNEYI